MDFSYQTVDELLGDFLEESDALLFAPSTIAVAALLVTYSVLEMDFAPCLDAIPDYILPHNSLSVFQPGSPLDPYFDIDACIVAFKRVPYFRMRLRKDHTVSPGSITQDLDLDFGIDEV
jgi:hypothetical protein